MYPLITTILIIPLATMIMLVFEVVRIDVLDCIDVEGLCGLGDMSRIVCGHQSNSMNTIG